MIDWDKLRIFHQVASAGSFTHAAEVLNLSQSSVSRQIMALEDSLNVILFHRHARGLILTDQGKALHQSCKEIANKIDKAALNLNSEDKKLSGKINVNAPTAVGSMWLAPLLREFNDKYPNIEINLILTEDELNIAMLEADIAIRIKPSTAAGLIQVKMFQYKIRAYASAEYLERHAPITSVNDLDFHDIILYSNTKKSGTALQPYDHEWLLKIGESNFKRKPKYTLNSLHGIYRLIRSGGGISALPEYMESLPGGLIEILPNIEHPQVNAYIVYPEEYKNIAKITAFKEFLISKAVLRKK